MDSGWVRDVTWAVPRGRLQVMAAQLRPPDQLQSSPRLYLMALLLNLGAKFRFVLGFASEQMEG